LEGARIDSRQNTGGCLPGTANAGLGDLLNQGLAIFQAGHASSPSWKIACSFFDILCPRQNPKIWSANSGQNFCLSDG
jgi:hypothetical protein